MKYSLDQAQQEVLRRSRILIRRREKRIINVLSATVCALVIILVSTVFLFSQGSPAPNENSVYGSFLLQQEAGGYVLVGVICFAAAVVITAICIRYRLSKDKRKEKENVQQDNSQQKL